MLYPQLQLVNGACWEAHQVKVSITLLSIISSIVQIFPIGESSRAILHSCAYIEVSTSMVNRASSCGDDEISHDEKVSPNCIIIMFAAALRDQKGSSVVTIACPA
jgi:hypothetical protein